MANEFIEKLAAQAKKDPKTIIFPETNEIKVYAAARRILDEGIAYPILVGHPDDIAGFAKDHGISIEGMRIVDNTDQELVQAVIKDFLALTDDFSEKGLNRRFKTPLNFAAAMVRTGRADALAAGIIHTTGEVILAAQNFIGMQEGVETISSIGIIISPTLKTSEGNLLGITDCAVCQNPDAAELADIAIASANTMNSLLGWEPRVAMLSFSTQGSSEHALVDKVREAVRIANEKRPDLKIDGEFQVDAALLPEIAAKKVKTPSEVAGKANIIVFPSLEAGNIGVKLIQMFSGATAPGPLLQGFAKPVTDFSRSAPVDEIVENLIMLAVRAQGAK